MKFQLIRPFVAVVLLLQAGFLWAQTNDSAKVNKLSFGIDFMTHGEMMRRNDAWRTSYRPGRRTGR